MNPADVSGHPDYLRSVDRTACVDPRNADVMILSELGFRQRTIEDHHRAVAALVLSDRVSENVRISFETAKNLYLYAWFVYRFYPVCRSHAYACLEFALRERLGRQLHASLLASKRTRQNKSAGRDGWQVPEAYEKFFPGLRRLLDFAAREGLIRNEGFEVWRNRDRAREDHRTEVEAIAQAIGVPVAWDDDNHHKFVTLLVDSVPAARNEHAHGTSALSSSVLGTLMIVRDIINQIH